MKKSKVFAIALVAGAAALASISAQASCYIVRNAKGQIISESPNPPVDMSQPVGQAARCARPSCECRRPWPG